MTMLGLLATLCVASSIGVFGTLVAGYSQALYPVAVLGASGMPRALGFNLLGFVVPGLLAAWLAVALRSALPLHAAWAARIGARMLVIAAVAFAAQGLLPLDSSELESPIMRLHAVAWLLWGIAFVTGAVLLAFGLRRVAGARLLAWGSAAAALAFLAMSLLPLPMLPPGVPPRLAIAAWAIWLVLAGIAGDRMRRVTA